MAKHANSTKFQSLTKAEKDRRYDQYLRSGPNPQFARVKAPSKSLSKPANALSSYSTPRNPPKMGDLAATKSASVRSAIESALGSGKLSPQGHDYLTARFNPFCPHLTNVGYPDPAPGGSRKVRGFSEVTVQCNAAGIGFVCASTDGCAVNTTQGIFYSQPTYVGSAGFPVATGAVGTTLASLAGVPFGTSDDPTNSILWRKLGFGIRVRSETALLNKAGIATSIDFPGSVGDLLNGTYSDSDYRSLFPYWSQGYVLNEGDSPWMSVIWSPKRPADAVLSPISTNASLLSLNWDSQNAIHGPVGATTGANYQYKFDVGICFVGAPNATFQCQIVGYYEYIGTQVNPQMISSLTPTYSDHEAAKVGEDAVKLQSVNTQSKAKDGGLSLTSVTNLLSGAAKQVPSLTSAFNSLKSYLPAPPPQPSMLSIEDISDSAQSMQGFLGDSSMPIIEEIAEEAPLLLMA